MQSYYQMARNRCLDPQYGPLDGITRSCRWCRPPTGVESGKPLPLQSCNRSHYQLLLWLLGYITMILTMNALQVRRVSKIRLAEFIEAMTGMKVCLQKFIQFCWFWNTCSLDFVYHAMHKESLMLLCFFTHSMLLYVGQSRCNVWCTNQTDTRI